MLDINQDTGLSVKDLRKILLNGYELVGEITNPIYETVLQKSLPCKKVIITENHIAHADKQHADTYFTYRKYMNEIINDPDIIMLDNRGDRLSIIKRIDKLINVVLSISLSKSKFNKIHTVWTTPVKKVEKLKQERKVLYERCKKWYT